MLCSLLLTIYLNRTIFGTAHLNILSYQAKRQVEVRHARNTLLPYMETVNIVYQEGFPHVNKVYIF